MATLKSIKNKYLTASDGTVLGVTTNTENISALSFKLATADSLTKFNLVDGFADDYNDATGVDASASTDEIRDSTGKYYSGSGSSTGVGEFVTDANTKLLYHFNGADASTTFTDSSGNSLTGVAYGNAQLDTAVKKLGTASYEAAGTNPYIITAASSLLASTGDFTLECWFNSTYTTHSAFLDFRTSTNGLYMDWHYQGPVGRLMFCFGDDVAASTRLFDCANSEDGNWHHFALVRDSDVAWYFYYDGVSISPVSGNMTSNLTKQINDDNSGILISTNPAKTGTWYGHKDEFRFSNSVRYPGGTTFTPNEVTTSVYNNMTLVSNTFTAQADPTTTRIILDEETAAGTTTLDTDIKAYASRDNGTTFTQMTLARQSFMAGTGIDENTKLMLHCDGANDGTTFTDSTFSPKTVTVVGNTHTDTAVKKFGTASAEFDGTTDKLSVASTADFNPFGVDFTVDFWLNVDSFAHTYDWLIGNSQANYSGWDIQLEQGGGKINFLVGNGSSWEINTVASATGYAISTDTWYHIAVVKNGTLWVMYVDGTSRASGSAVGHDYTAQLDIGGSTLWAGRDFDGYMDEVRISKGVARWTANFTPPTAAYTSRRLLSGSVDISGQPAGSNVKYKIETLNQSVSKQTRVYGTSMAWA